MLPPYTPTDLTRASAEALGALFEVESLRQVVSTSQVHDTTRLIAAMALSFDVAQPDLTVIEIGRPRDLLIQYLKERPSCPVIDAKKTLEQNPDMSLLLATIELEDPVRFASVQVWLAARAMLDFEVTRPLAPEEVKKNLLGTIIARPRLELTYEELAQYQRLNTRQLRRLTTSSLQFNCGPSKVDPTN